MKSGGLEKKNRTAKIGTKKDKRFDAVKLKDPRVREQINITLRIRYSILRDETTITIDQFHQTMNNAAAETIGYKRRAKTEWLSKGTWSIKVEENPSRCQIAMVERKQPLCTERKIKTL